MALLTWNKKYQVGIAEFDEQHKIIIKMINKLYDAMKEGRGKESLGTILNELIEYAKNHFENEEKYFKKFNYPDQVQHIALHNAFRAAVLDLKKRADDGKLLSLLNLCIFLNSGF